VNASQLCDLLAAVMQGVRDVTTEVCDAGHVRGQVIHLILHLTEVILHLNRGQTIGLICFHTPVNLNNGIS